MLFTSVASLARIEISIYSLTSKVFAKFSVATNDPRIPREQPSTPITQPIMGRLTDFEKGRITGGWQLFGSVAKILPLVPGRSESTVRSFVRRWIQRGSYENLPASGRPPLLTKLDKRRLCREARKERRKPLTELRNEVSG